MNGKLLCECPNQMTAHRVISQLNSKGIPFRQHDEQNASRTGAYGPTPGIAIYVQESDYDRAKSLVDPIINAPTNPTSPFCPKCGSEEVSRLTQSKYTTPLLLLSIFLFIAPIVFLYYSNGRESTFVYYLCLATFISSIVIIAVCSRKGAEYKCNQCGKKFNRR